MQTQSNAVAASAPEYTAEIRFGVVMYGGVSLAIYINGVANELFEMACATPRPGFAIGPGGGGGTREIYRRLSWLAGSPELRAKYASGIRTRESAWGQAGAAAPADVWPGVDGCECTQTRLAIDVVSGTSAGGINGIFLAKALANGEQFAPLKDLWITEGDISLLLNDSRSDQGLAPPLPDRSRAPQSLLNSDRMYAKLLFALEQMGPLEVARADGASGSPLVDEVDLFVTATDIKGAPVPLRLFDKVVYERRFKQSFHFSRPGGATHPSGNDFDLSNNRFLAFAARCTSSFPFAFEPMKLDAVARLSGDGLSSDLERWKAFFPNLPRDEVENAAHLHRRAFGDGGYLDNKPFTYVVDTLSQRSSDLPLERKLVYVEPAPERLDPHEPLDPQPPDALQNSLAALAGIPRYETIREDLQSVLQRNRRIERVERMVRLGELDIEGQNDPYSGVMQKDGRIPPWSSLRLSQMIRYYGLAFVPYQRLRVYSVTDTLADRLGLRWGIDRESDQQYALRALVRVWRESLFDDEGSEGHQTVNAFLDQFDVDYRVRRLGLLLRKIDQLTRLFRKRAGLPGNVHGAAAPATLSELEQHLVARLEPYRMVPAQLEEGEVTTALRVLGSLKVGLAGVRDSLLQAQHGRDGAAGPAGAPDAARRKELTRVVLPVVLGQAPADRSAELETVKGRPVPVGLDPQMLKLASISRTLQESVMARARALFAATGSVPRTRLQDALEADLEAMRFKLSAGRTKSDPPPKIDTPLSLIAGKAWSLLGEPELQLSGDKKKVIVVVGDAAGDLVRDAGKDLDSPAGRALRHLLGDYLLRFDSFDQMSFPLYYDTGTGEPSTVETVRISPADATNLIDEAHTHRKKLAGTALGNFGAFLDRRWRLNDIMWGRLDGAERLLQALLPMSDEDTEAVRKELIERAQLTILREALVPEGKKDLVDLVIKALGELPPAEKKDGDAAKESGAAKEGAAAKVAVAARDGAPAKGTGQGAAVEAAPSPDSSLEVQLRGLLTQLWTGDAAARERLAGVLASVLSEQGLLDYVRNGRDIDRNPDPRATMENVGRAVTITGRVLEGISAKHGTGSLLPRWLARLGLAVQGIVAVSLPGTLRQRWWTHGVKVLYAFELVALVMALFLGGAETRTVAVTALGVTAAVHLLTLIAGDVMREKKGWVKALAVGVVLTVLTLAVLGGRAVWHWAIH